MSWTPTNINKKLYFQCPIIFCLIILTNRMLTDFYIPRLSNDMKIAVQKNNLGGKFGT